MMSGLPSWARTGAKIVCVTDGWHRGQTLSLWRWLATKLAGLPIRGGLYVVTKAGFFQSEPVVCLRGWGPLVFPTRAFRPLITLEDDIEAHFKALLSTDHKVDA